MLSWIHSVKSNEPTKADSSVLSAFVPRCQEQIVLCRPPAEYDPTGSGQ